MDEITVSVATYNFKKEFVSLTNALKLEPAYEYYELEDPKNAATFVVTEQASLVIISVNSKEDLIRLASLVKEAKKKHNRVVKFAVYTTGGHQFDKAISKLGIMDFVEANATTKALRYKVDFWVKSLKAQLKKTNYAETMKAKGAGADAKAEEKRAANSIVWEAPMDNTDDMWILKSDEHCRNIMKRWMVKLMGPSPYVGRWVETTSRGVWAFKFKDEDNSFCSQVGQWYFRGNQKPDFIWKENLWLFTSEQFDLFYQQKGGSPVVRMCSKQRVLTICKNSEFAKTKEDIIVESFDRELVFGGEAAEEESKDVIENDGLKGFDPLKGKGKTDQLAGGPLSGKQKGSDHLGGGPLSGDGETDDVTSPLLAMGLKPGDQDVSDGALEGRFEAEESPDWNEDDHHETEHLSGFYGKDAKRKAQRDDESGKPLVEKLKPEGKKGALAGKSKTDDVTSPLLAMGLEDGDQDVSDGALEGSFADDESPEWNEDDSHETEHLSGHYGKGKKRESERRDLERALSGASDTDHIKTHYGTEEDEEASAEAELQDDDAPESYDDESEEFPEEEASPLRAKSGEGKRGKQSERKAGQPEEEAESPAFMDRLAEKKKQQKERNSGPKPAAAEVHSIDHLRNLKLLFEKAAKQYKRG